MTIMKKPLVTVFCMLLLAGTTAFAGNLKFSSFIGDNMVLQQSTDVRIWGFADPGSSVSVSASWLSSSVSAKADSKGCWEVKLRTPAATFSPQTVRARSGGETVTAQNVLIGEVWLCSGQSNMEMRLSGGYGTPVEGSLQEIAQSGKYKGVRQFEVRKAQSLVPEIDAAGEWKLCNPENSPSFSAVGYFFATRLSEILNVPVGIINASWGGSVIEAWMNEGLLKDYPDVDLANASDSKVNAMYKPMIMYNAMFHPASRYSIAGILWFQGESNISISYLEYADRLTAMAELWRNDIGRGDIPFLIVELTPYDYYDGPYGFQDEHGPIVREQQFIASTRIPNAAIIGTNDLAYPYEQKQIHASKKREIGERLCYMALFKNYGFSTLQALNPCFKSAEVRDGRVLVRFDNARLGFMGTDEIKGFEVAGGGGTFHPAHAEIMSGGVVAVWCDLVPNPVEVRYCFKDFEVGTLIGGNGLPVIPFRAKVEQPTQQQ